MLDILKLVRGAVSTKDLVPTLTHFCIYAGRLQGANGFLCIDSECSELAGLDCTVPADRFLRAIDACKGEPKLKVDGTDLIVSKAKFKAKIATRSRTEYPLHERETGTEIRLLEPLLPRLRALRPFIGEDASRRWSLALCWQAGWLYASNNVVVVRVPLKIDAPEGTIIQIPSYLVEEALRIGEEPQQCHLTENSLTLTYHVFWLKGSLTHERWPDGAAIIEKADFNGCAQVPAGLLDAAETVSRFTVDAKSPIIELTEDAIQTPDAEHSAVVDGFRLAPGAYRSEILLLVLSAAKKIDFSAYPGAVPFEGANGMQGVFVGVRK